jgi:hypothetical protein
MQVTNSFAPSTLENSEAAAASESITDMPTAAKALLLQMSKEKAK